MPILIPGNRMAFPVIVVVLWTAGSRPSRVAHYELGALHAGPEHTSYAVGFDSGRTFCDPEQLGFI